MVPADSPRSGRLLRNTVVLGLARVLDRAGGFILAILIAPRLGAAGLGTYSAAMAIYTMIAIAGEAGTTNFLVREISKDRSRTGSYIVHLSVAAALAALVLMGVVELVVGHLGYSPELRTSVSIVVLAILPTVLNGIQEAAFLAYGRVELETITTLVSTLAYIAIGAVLLGLGHGIPTIMVLYVGLEYLVTAVYFVLITRYVARLRLAFRWRLARRLIWEMKAFSGSSALAALFSRPEVVVLSLMASPREVGYYAAAVRVAEVPTFVPQVFTANVFPLLAEAHGSSEEPMFAKLQARAIRAMLAFSLPVAALMLALAHQIIPALFGDGFGPSVEVLRILAITVVCVSLAAVFWRTLAARGRQRDVLAVQALMIGARLGGAALLIGPLGAAGAAIANSANSAVHVALLAAANARSGARAAIVRPGWRFAVAAALAAAVVWLLSPILSVWALGPLGVAIYLGVAALEGGLRGELRRVLDQVAARRTANRFRSAGGP